MWSSDKGLASRQSQKRPLRKTQHGSVQSREQTLSPGVGWALHPPRCLESGMVHLGLQELVKFMFFHEVLSVKQPSSRKWLNSTFLKCMSGFIQTFPFFC